MEYPKDELKVLAKANLEFFKRYLISIVAGFSAPVYILKRRKVPLNSRNGYLSIFGGGLAGEYFGRVWGNSAQDRITSQLGADSYLNKVKRGELEVRVAVDEVTKRPNVKLYPKGDSGAMDTRSNPKIQNHEKGSANNGPISSIPQSNIPQVKLNKYGDEIIVEN